MANPRTRRHQAGSVWLRGPNFYLRYYGPDRRQKTELLCARDDKQHSKTCAPVKKLARPVTLAEVKADARFKDFPLTYLPRLSVMPVTDAQWKALVEMSTK